MAATPSPFRLRSFVLALASRAAWRRVAPGLAFVATFLVQTHLGTGRVACAVAGRSSRRRVGRFALRPAIVTAAVLAVLWLPPALEEWRGTPQHPGNLTLLWRFFTTQRASHTFVEVFGPLAHELGGIPIALVSAVVPGSSDERDVGAGIFALLLVALLPLSLAMARRRRDDETSGLFWLAAAGIVAQSLWG